MKRTLNPVTVGPDDPVKSVVFHGRVVHVSSVVIDAESSVVVVVGSRLEGMVCDGIRRDSGRGGG